MAYKRESISFIADVMLGKLAKWLRILGFDVLYNSHLDDKYILETALKENRVILTKDKRLYDSVSKLPLICIFIYGNGSFAQLKSLIKILNLKKDDIAIFSRCVMCNSLISVVNKQEVEGLVPDFVYDTVLYFSKCKNCGKIYWKGSHQNRVEKIIDKLFDE